MKSSETIQNAENLFACVSKWFSKQDFRGFLKVCTEVYRHKDAVIVFDATKNSAKLKCYCFNTTIEFCSNGEVSKLETSAKNTVLSAAFLADNWGLIKSKVEAVIRDERVKIDNDFKSLGSDINTRLIMPTINKSNWN